MASGESRRAEALNVAERLLSDIELSAIEPIDAARRASRLARLLDDGEAMAWLRYEVAGYPHPPDQEACAAARRSNREAAAKDRAAGDEGPAFWTGSLGQMNATLEACKARLPVADDGAERNGVLQAIRQQQGILDAVIGAIHSYVADRYQELRFGSAVESAFEVVRRQVDSSVGEIVPGALPMLSAAFENATSANPEDWANAAGTCRRLLKAVADELRPPGADVGGRKMGDGNYINRLVDWIATNSESETTANLVTADLDDLGRRLDAADGAGQKGAHATVGRFEASRFITGTYLVLGDVLQLAPPAPAEVPSDPVESDGTGDPPRPEADLVEPAQPDP